LDHWITGSLDHWITGSLDHWITGSPFHEEPGRISWKTRSQGTVVDFARVTYTSN
jgi:hypothetical protein